MIIAEVAIGIAVLMYGFLKLEWGTGELTGMFILLSFIAALIDKKTVSEFFDEFLTGCENVIFGALIVGVAAAILLVMQKGNDCRHDHLLRGQCDDACTKGFGGRSNVDFTNTAELLYTFRVRTSCDHYANHGTNCGYARTEQTGRGIGLSVW